VSRDVHHPLFARLFDRMAEKTEEQGAAEHRDRLLAGLNGRVLEVGAGNGLNFPHYPATASEVLAVEPEDYLRAKAEQAAEGAPIPIRVVDGLAERLPADDASLDAVVASLVLCSVRDQATALAEVRRVLRPDGELRFYERPLVGRWEELRIEVEEVFSAGELIVLFVRQTGCGLSSGVEVENRVGFLWRVGRVVRFEVFPRRAEALGGSRDQERLPPG